MTDLTMYQERLISADLEFFPTVSGCVEQPCSLQRPPSYMSPREAERSVPPSPRLRKNSQPHSHSLPPISLTFGHIQDALIRSNDGGKTLVLMKKGFTDVGSDVAEELAAMGRENSEDESVVQRISLGHNRLTALPMEFALLSRLRYLNLKSNCFTVFPDVLTVIPALDTLDISHNKIKRLPSQPGTLVNLRVFCFSRNKITKLPAYFSRFHKLSVLQIEKNPIEWPPKSVMEPPDLVAGTSDSISWIKSVQRWMEAEAHPHGNSYHDDSGFSEHHDLENRLDEAYTAWSSRLPRTDSEFDDGVTPHARSFSVDSNFSLSSAADSVNIDTPSSYGQPDRPPPLHLGILQSYSSEASPTRSLESYLPSPADSDTFFGGQSINGADHPTDSDVDADYQRQSQIHARNASYAAGSIRGPTRSEFMGKKSMPDLRTAKLNFSKKSIVLDPLPPLRADRVSPFSATTSATTPSTSTPTNNRANFHHYDDSFSIPSPLSQRQDSSGSSNTSNSRSHIHIRAPFAATSTPQEKDGRHTSPTRTVPSMAFERNSYFRRMSSLPTATTNALPAPLLNLVETARSILFAVCQIYQTLEQYTFHHTIDERLSSVLKKMLHPASADMMQFINSLDRFDAMSRKTIPPPTVCRGVVESCRDTVAVFGKTVGVLSLQLKVIVNVDDLRYVRALLIQLYGASAEISLAWQGMIPLMESVKPYLHSKPFPAPSPPSLVGLENHNGAYTPGPASAPPVSSKDGNAPPHLLSLRANSTVRTHTARRHAGSFSSKDVEIGKKLPSYEDMPSLSGGIALHTPTLRTPKRQLTSSSSATTLTIQGPSPTGPLSMSASASSSSISLSSVSASIVETSRAVGHSNQSHSRSGSQTSLHAASSSSSVASSPSLPPSKPTSFLELPSTSKTLVDNEALQAVHAAVEIAPTVWDLMESVLLGREMSSTSNGRHEVNVKDVKESLNNAREVTRRLRECVQVVMKKEGDKGDVGAEKKSLRDEAHLFLKSVVQLSNTIKIHGGVRSPALRTNMVKLTNATEEFAILLHVSSFSPSPTPTTASSTSSATSVRPYSPSPSALMSLSASTPVSAQPQANHLHLPDWDNRDRGLGLGPGLSRSRSAQTSAGPGMASATASRLGAPSSPAALDGPRSAQPLQSFKLPVIRRLRDREPNALRID